MYKERKEKGNCGRGKRRTKVERVRKGKYWRGYGKEKWKRIYGKQWKKRKDGMKRKKAEWK